MGKIISLKKEEKLAILKIMIDINNHYDRNIPDGFNIIQEAASSFNINNAISTAYNLPISTAVETLKSLCENYEKDNFFQKLIAYMLSTGNFDIIKKAEKFDDEYDEKIDKLYDLNISDEELEKLEEKIDDEYWTDIEPIHIELEKELHYCFKLMRECNSKLSAGNFPWNYNPLKDNDWIIINETEELTMSNEINTTGAKDETEAIIAHSNEVGSKNQNISYSDLIKETLYKDL